MTSTTSKPTKSIPVRLRTIGEHVVGRRPARFGRPGPRRERSGRRTSMSKRQPGRPVADAFPDPRGAACGADAQEILGGQVVEPELGSQDGPVGPGRRGSAQADLDRVADVDQALLDRPTHPRAVVVLLPEVASQASVWASKSMTATGPCDRIARRWASVQAWSPPISNGTTPAATRPPDRRLDRRVARLDVAGHDRDVAIVDAREDFERGDAQVRVDGRSIIDASRHRRRPNRRRPDTRRRCRRAPRSLRDRRPRDR